MRAEELSTLVDNIFRDDNRDLTQTFEPEIVVEITSDLEAITNITTPILPNDVTAATDTLDLVLS